MADISIIYKVWDNNAEAMAADLGMQGVTVRQWRNRPGGIPPEYWERIIEAAAVKGVTLQTTDFPAKPEFRALIERLADERAAA